MLAHEAEGTVVDVGMITGEHDDSELRYLLDPADNLAELEQSCRVQKVDRRVREDDPR